MPSNGLHGDNTSQQKKQTKTKRCSKCGEEKTVSEFHKGKGGKYGVRSVCKECTLKTVLAWQRKNKEKHREAVARFASRNRDKIRAKSHRRRARSLNAKGFFTANDWQQRLAYHGFKCVYCGVEKHETPEGWLSCDHMIPLSKGGQNWPSNLVPACRSCNSSKGSKTYFEYMEQINGSKDNDS